LKNFLLGIIFVLLPDHWRADLPHAGSINWREAAVASGAVQIIISLYLYTVWFIHSAGSWAHAPVTATAKAQPEMSVGSATIGSLVFTLIFLHPLTWILLYFAYEGIVRIQNARARASTRGTLPLRLIDRTIRYAKSGTWSDSPKLVCDEVSRTSGPHGLRIASCRAKAHWKYPLSIRHQEEFFQVMGEERGPSFSARPYIYLLRSLPANEIIKGLEPYDPAAVLAEETPGFFGTVFGEIRRLTAK
jgi:hypothetical protein